MATGHLYRSSHYRNNVTFGYHVKNGNLWCYTLVNSYSSPWLCRVGENSNHLVNYRNSLRLFDCFHTERCKTVGRIFIYSARWINLRGNICMECTRFTGSYDPDG